MKKLTLGLIVATAFVGAILHSTAYLFRAAESENSSLSAGHRAFAGKDFRQALVHYRKAVTEDPDNAVAQAWLGYMAAIFGEREEALSGYEKSATLAPSAASYFRLGTFAGQIDETQIAVNALQKSLSMASQDIEPTAKSKGPQPQKIAHALFRVLFEAPDRDRALSFARSQGWIRDGVDFCKPDPTRAISYQTAELLAVLVHPHRAGCALELAEDVTDSGDYRLPRMILGDLVRDSENPETKQKAEAFIRHRLPAHVIDKRTEWLNGIGSSLKMHFKLPDEALELLKKAIAADAKFAQPYYRIGYIYWEKNDHDEAISWLRRALSVQPDHWRAIYILGCVFSSLNRHDEALAQYRKAVELNPEDAGSFYNIGTTLSEQEKFEEALPNLQKAVTLEPIDAYKRWYLSWVLNKLGREREARKEWFIAIKLDPKLAKRSRTRQTAE